MMWRVLAILALSLIILGCARDPMNDDLSAQVLSDKLVFYQDSGTQIKLARPTTGSGQAVQNKSAVRKDLTFPTSWNYGYGAIDPFLAYADYLHWQDYNLNSVVELRYGKSNTTTTTYTNATNSCWNFSVQSSAPVLLWRVDSRPELGGGSLNAYANSISVVWNSPGNALAGMIFTVDSANATSSCAAPSQNWYGSNTNPYSAGYSGYYGNYYYYYPPYPCSAAHQNATVTVTGTVTPCDANGTILGAAQSFTVDLSTYINQMQGYLPYISQTLSGGGSFNGRVVNYSGTNWY